MGTGHALTKKLFSCGIFQGPGHAPKLLNGAEQLNKQALPSDALKAINIPCPWKFDPSHTHLIRICFNCLANLDVKFIIRWHRLNAQRIGTCATIEIPSNLQGVGATGFQKNRTWIITEEGLGAKNLVAVRPIQTHLTAQQGFIEINQVDEHSSWLVLRPNVMIRSSLLLDES